MQRSWEQSVVFAAGLAGVLWVAGAALFIVSQGRTVERLGLLLLIVASTVTALGVLRSWQLRMHRAFVHGYHAGFHDGIGKAKPSTAKNCDVLELSEVKARRLARLG